MTGGQHPVPGPLTPHPWDNPRVSQPAGFDRPPDWTRQFAPDPRDFPFNEQGQRDYYAATITAAHQQADMRRRFQAVRDDQEQDRARLLLLLI